MATGLAQAVATDRTCFMCSQVHLQSEYGTSATTHAATSVPGFCEHQALPLDHRLARCCGQHMQSIAESNTCTAALEFEGFTVDLKIRSFDLFLKTQPPGIRHANIDAHELSRMLCPLLHMQWPLRGDALLVQAAVAGRRGLSLRVNRTAGKVGHTHGRVCTSM